LAGVKTVHALQVNFAEPDPSIENPDHQGFVQKYRIEGSTDAKTWTTLIDRSNNTQDMPHDYCELRAPAHARYVRFTAVDTGKAGGLAIRDLRIFGNGGGTPPAAVTGLTVSRDPQDDRHATITWKPSQGAEGYVVRYGPTGGPKITPYEIRDATRLEIHSLNADVRYDFTVEAFNENGVTPMKPATNAQAAVRPATLSSFQ